MCIICEGGEIKGSLLSCTGCPTIKEIPNVKGITKLYCNNCPQLKRISKIEGLEELYCANNPRLKKIPDIKELEFLDISGSRVKTIPNFANLVLLQCHESRYLKKIPILKKLRVLSIFNCPLLYIPKEMERCISRDVEFARNRKGKLFIWKLKRHANIIRNKIKMKSNMYNLPLSKDVVKYVIGKY